MGNANIVPIPKDGDWAATRRAIQLLAHALGVDASVLFDTITTGTLNASILNAPHTLTGANHTVTGLTPGDVLTALTSSTFGFTTPSSGDGITKVADDAARLALTVTAGDMVYQQDKQKLMYYVETV